MAAGGEKKTSGFHLATPVWQNHIRDTHFDCDRSRGDDQRPNRLAAARRLFGWGDLVKDETNGGPRVTGALSMERPTAD